MATWNVEVPVDRQAVYPFEEVEADDAHVSDSGALVFTDGRFKGLAVAYAAGQWLTVTKAATT